MEIYKHEIEAGLAEKIQANKSLSFYVPLVPPEPYRVKANISGLPDKVRAAINDPDLKVIPSVLVSTTWNRNDDIFDKYETWKARHTPTFKPANIDHDEDQIVGTIIGTWAADENYNVIPDNIPLDDLPDYYHLIVASAIYTQWSKPENRERVNKLLDAIHAGQKYVSMEAIFSGFDYGIQTPDGTFAVIERNDETSFLTSHLRAYGGKGVYEGHRVGRLLKNITFVGKGFVDIPANPDSVIILDDENVNRVMDAIKTDLSIFGVKSNEPVKAQLDREKHTMSDELKDLLAQAQKENEELKRELEELKAKRHEDTIADLKAQLEELQKAKSEAETQRDEVLNQIKEVKAELEKAQKEAEEAQAQMDKMKKEQKKKDRKNKLMAAGLKEEEAEKQVELFANLTDEQFDGIVQLFEAKAASADANDSNDDDTNDDNVDDVVNADDNTAKGTHNVGDDNGCGDDALEKARAGFMRWVEKNVCGIENNEE